MSYLTRIAKDGQYWSSFDLQSYNIIVVGQKKKEFFGTCQPRPPTEPALVEFMTIENTRHAPNADAEVKKLLFYHQMACSPSFSGGATMGNLLYKLLEKLGYDEGDGVIVNRHGIAFINCNRIKQAETELSVLDNNDNTVRLLVGGKEDNPEPPIIAAAIAAYDENNRLRQDSGLNPLPSITFPAITLNGLDITFYKITITEELSVAVRFGTYPPTTTRVLKHIPVLRDSLGINPPANRRELLSCLAAFRQFL